jgi:hypothetical protein
MPRFRVGLRMMLALIAAMALLLGWAADRERLRRRAYGVLNQDITVKSAEANYRNAGLAREAAEAAVARYERESGGDGEPPTLRALRDAAKQARRRELDLGAIWRLEMDTLSRLIRELYDSRL